MKFMAWKAKKTYTNIVLMLSSPPQNKTKAIGWKLKMQDLFLAESPLDIDEIKFQPFDF